VLVFEDVEGWHPAQPWQPDELDRVLNALHTLSAALTPSPLSTAIAGAASDAFANRICGWGKLRDEEPFLLAGLDSWSARHLEALVELEAAAPTAVEGETLLHFDVRADNILLTPEQVWFVDWPHARIGAAWVDVVSFAPSVRMQGGPPPEAIISRHTACQSVDPAAITAAIVAVAGFFTYGALQPPPPGLPTLRAFQAAQGAVAREWVAQRTGWT
jgi:aminoglycoside phosphotransferase (APT) family kinase protein